MLKIIKQDDTITVSALVATLYAPPGLGKTSLAYSANKPLLIDFDRGAHRAVGRKDTVQVESWSELEAMTQADLEPYQTLVIDTVGRCLDYLSAYIVKTNPKLGTVAGGLTLQGYGELKSRFARWVSTVRTYGLDLVLIAHSDEQHKGDDIIERIDAQGGSKQEIYKISDLMGKLKMIPGQRFPSLTFSPSDTAFGKDPAQIGVVQIPNLEAEPDFLGKLMGRVRDHLNSMSKEQQERQESIAQWQEAADSADTVVDMNTLLGQVIKAKATIKTIAKRIVHDRATKLELVYSKEDGCYVDPAAKDDDAPDADGAA